MATLHMNTEAARSTASTMRNSSTQMTEALTTASNNVNALLGGEWMGNSATQFQGEYEQWRSALQNALTVLDQLTQRLDREIIEWETAAQNL